MPILVDEILSEVTTEPEAAPSMAAGPAPEWQELDRFRAAQARLRADRRRTAAEGYDD